MPSFPALSPIQKPCPCLSTLVSQHMYPLPIFPTVLDICTSGKREIRVEGKRAQSDFTPRLQARPERPVGHSHRLEAQKGEKLQSKSLTRRTPDGSSALVTLGLSHDTRSIPLTDWLQPLRSAWDSQELPDRSGAKNTNPTFDFNASGLSESIRR